MFYIWLPILFKNWSTKKCNCAHLYLFLMLSPLWTYKRKTARAKKPNDVYRHLLNFEHEKVQMYFAGNFEMYTFSILAVCSNWFTVQHPCRHSAIVGISYFFLWNPIHLRDEERCTTNCTWKGSGTNILSQLKLVFNFFHTFAVEGTSWNTKIPQKYFN